MPWSSKYLMLTVDTAGLFEFRTFVCCSIFKQFAGPSLGRAPLLSLGNSLLFPLSADLVCLSHFIFISKQPASDERVRCGPPREKIALSPLLSLLITGVVSPGQRSDFYLFHLESYKQPFAPTTGCFYLPFPSLGHVVVICFNKSSGSSYLQCRSVSQSKTLGSLRAYWFKCCAASWQANCLLLFRQASQTEAVCGCTYTNWMSVLSQSYMRCKFRVLSEFSSVWFYQSYHLKILFVYFLVYSILPLYLLFV